MPNVMRPGSPMGRPWPRLEHRAVKTLVEANGSLAVRALLRDIKTLEDLIEEMMGEDNAEINALRDDLEEANDRAVTAEDNAREVDDLRGEVEDLTHDKDELEEEVERLQGLLKENGVDY